MFLTILNVSVARLFSARHPPRSDVALLMATTSRGPSVTIKLHKNDVEDEEDCMAFGC